MTPEPTIEDLMNVEDEKKKLDEISQSISENVQNIINVEKLSKFVILYNQSPTEFSKIKSSLSPSELSEFQKLANFSNELLNRAPNTQIKQFVDFKNPSPSLLNTEINLAYTQFLDISEKLEQKYDETNLLIQKLLNMNPLDLIKFGDTYRLEKYFNIYADKLIKSVTSFFIEEIKESTQVRSKSKKGKINFPDTIRASMKYQGDPYELKRRRKPPKTRKTKPTIYILIDVSGSQESGMFISIALAYAIIHALPDYEVVLYTSSTEALHISNSSTNHKNPSYPHDGYVLDSNSVKDIQLAESKNLTEVEVAGSNSLRFNKKSLQKYARNPILLYKIMVQNSTGADNDYHFITKSLGTVIADDSLIIAFGDDGQINANASHGRENYNKHKKLASFANYGNFYFNDYLGSWRKKIKKSLQNKCFSFYTNGGWTKEAIARIDLKTDFTFPPTKTDFNFEDYIFYPVRPPTSHLPYPETYGDWSRQIIKLLSARINVRKLK